MHANTVDCIYQAIVTANLAEADERVAEATRNLGHEEVLARLLTPLLDRIGDVEETKALSLAQGYVASKIVKRILADYERAISLSGKQLPPRDTVVMSNAEDDCHPLGRMIVTAMLRGRGWGVVDLGIDVEASTLLDEAENVGAKVVGVSAMTYTTARNIRRVREEITTRGLAARVKLIVGGVAFRLDPGLVAEVGADGTARTAIEAPALFRRMWDDVAAAEREEP